jgi:hypothetical protein
MGKLQQQCVGSGCGLLKDNPGICVAGMRDKQINIILVEVNEESVVLGRPSFIQ